MPKVLRILNRLNIGGPTYNAGYLSKFLPEPYETLLAAGLKDDTEASSDFIVTDMGLTPEYIPNMFREISPLNDWKAYWNIRKMIRTYKPDIVHTHAAKAGALGRLAAHHENVPVILHTFHGHVFHSYFSSLKTQLFLRIERYLAKASTRIIAISKTQKHDLGTIYKVCTPDKIEVVPLGFDLSRFQETKAEKRRAFRQKYHLEEDEVAIGIIGRLVPIKNHSFFIDVISALLKRTQVKVRAFIIGDGEERQNLEFYAQEANLPFTTEKNLAHIAPLTFTSWIKEIDVVTAGLDIVAMTSLNEGTPVSLIEAQAANKPIVSTRVGGLDDIVLENKTAFLSESGDFETFTKNLLKLVESPALREEMGSRGSEMVMKQFSYMRLVGDMARLYDSLLKLKDQKIELSTYE